MQNQLWLFAGLGLLTLKAALYGTPIGRLAKTANNLLAKGDLKARLWEISWMARKRFWFAVAPIMYAVRKNWIDTMDVSRKAEAQNNCSAMTIITQYLVKGSGPHSLRTYQSSSVSRVDFGVQFVCTSGWALIIHCLLVLCGSSVYDQRKWSHSEDGGFGSDDNDISGSALTWDAML